MPAQPSHMNRAQRNIAWIEEWCRQPDGGMICLSTHARETVAAISTEPQPPRPLPTELAAYLALLHLAGPEYRHGPWAGGGVDGATLWRAAGPDLRAVLSRDGDAIVCPELGTRYPAPPDPCV